MQGPRADPDGRNGEDTLKGRLERAQRAMGAGPLAVTLNCRHLLFSLHQRANAFLKVKDPKCFVPSPSSGYGTKSKK